MTNEHGKLEGNIQVDRELILYGMITGDTVVLRGGELRLHGMCAGNLTIMEGGRAYLHGTVGGNVYNRQGGLEIWGIIVGQLSDDNRDAKIHRGAIISGSRH